MKLIATMHKVVLGNVEQTQAKQRKTQYPLRKGKQNFARFRLGLNMVKMKKLSKKKTLIRGWEGLVYLFVGRANGKGGGEP